MRRAAIVAGVVVVVALAGGALWATGMLGGTGLAPGGSDAPLGDSDGSQGTTDPGGVDSGGSDSGRSNDSNGTSTASPTGYTFVIDEIEKCGNTCRDVTATLTNDHDEARRNVTVTSKIYADDDQLWSGTEQVGRLEPGEAHTSTRRVKLSYFDGAKIQNNDGYVTIVTIVRSENGTQRFSERRKVA